MANAGIKSSQAGTSLRTIKTNIGTAWENVKSNTSTAWENIKETINEKGGGIKGVIGTAEVIRLNPFDFQMASVLIDDRGEGKQFQRRRSRRRKGRRNRIRICSE